MARRLSSTSNFPRLKEKYARIYTNPYRHMHKAIRTSFFAESVKFGTACFLFNTQSPENISYTAIWARRGLDNLSSIWWLGRSHWIGGKQTQRTGNMHVEWIAYLWPFFLLFFQFYRLRVFFFFFVFISILIVFGVAGFASRSFTLALNYNIVSYQFGRMGESHFKLRTVVVHWD